jgi:thioredoxin-like negative regulator of GroEL
LRIAVWRLEAGAKGDAELFARAADRALAAPDVALAERLARAALQERESFEVWLTLGRALAGAGRGPEAQRVLARLASQAADDRQRVAVAVASARNLFWR